MRTIVFISTILIAISTGAAETSDQARGAVATPAPAKPAPSAVRTATYPYLCTFSGHFQPGMKGAIAVK
jgi:hypothetical protein